MPLFMQANRFLDVCYEGVPKNNLQRSAVNANVYASLGCSDVYLATGTWYSVKPYRWQGVMEIFNWA